MPLTPIQCPLCERLSQGLVNFSDHWHYEHTLAEREVYARGRRAALAKQEEPDVQDVDFSME